MSKRIRSAIIYIALLCVIFDLLPTVEVKAASATVTLSLKNTDIKLNDTFNVIVEVNADTEIGGFETFLSYDETRMKFIDGGSLVTGDDGILRISDMNPENIVTNRKYVLQFKAIEQGNAQIEAMDQAYVYTYEDSAEMSVSCNRLSISIGTDEKLSNNAKLYSLKISPGTLSPEFSTKTTKYTTEVESDVDELVISAMAQDGDAKVKTKGNKSLKPGNNEVNIIVTAPSGDEKTYTIIVAKKESMSPDNGQTNTDGEEVIPTGDDSSENTELQDEILKEEGLLVTEENNEIKLQFESEYTIVPLEDPMLIPDGYEATTMILQDITVDAYEPIGAMPGDYVLLYMKHDGGEPRFYRYDKEERTIQRYDANTDHIQNATSEGISHDEYAKKLSNMKILVAISCAIALIATLVVIRLLVKLRGIKDDEFF